MRNYGWSIRPRNKFDGQIAISRSQFLTVLQKFSSNISLLIFSIPLSWRIFYIIQSIPNHFHCTLVHHSALNSSMCPIEHLFWLFCKQQWLKTLFRGLLHINAVRKAAVVYLMRHQQLFFKIFLYLYQLRTCLKSIFIVEISWKITQVTRMPA